MKGSAHRRLGIWPGLLVTAMALNACNKNSKDDDEDEDSTTTGGTVSGSGGGAGTTLNVSTLSALPNMEEIVQSTSAGLGLLAVSGTPPAFKDITADNIEGYLTGSVTDLVAAITAAKLSANWTEVRALADSFRDGMAKCNVIQDAARGLSELTQRTNAACMMTRVDAPGAGIMQYVSGEELAEGEFFKAASADVVRQIAIGAPDSGDVMVAQIQGTATEAGVYQVSLTRCKSGTAVGSDRIRIDQAAGLMSFDLAHAGSEDVNGVTRTHQSSGQVSGYLTASGAALAFDLDRPRTMTLANKGTMGGQTHQFNTSLTVDADTMTTKFFGANSFEADGQSSSGTHRGVTSVRFSGTKASDAVIFEGAGNYKGSFKRGAEAAFEHTLTVGFEFDEAQTPSYATTGASTYLDTVNSVDMDTDPLLAAAAPEDPETTAVDDAVCALTPSSVYRLRLAAPAMLEIKETCTSRFDHADRICDDLRDRQHLIWEALRADPG